MVIYILTRFSKICFTGWNDTPFKTKNFNFLTSRFLRPHPQPPPHPPLKMHKVIKHKINKLKTYPQDGGGGGGGGAQPQEGAGAGAAHPPPHPPPQLKKIFKEYLQ